MKMILIGMLALCASSAVASFAEAQNCPYGLPWTCRPIAGGGMQCKCGY